MNSKKIVLKTGGLAWGITSLGTTLLVIMSFLAQEGDSSALAFPPVFLVYVLFMVGVIILAWIQAAIFFGVCSFLTYFMVRIEKEKISQNLRILSYCIKTVRVLFPILVIFILFILDKIDALPEALSLRSGAGLFYGNVSLRDIPYGIYLIGAITFLTIHSYFVKKNIVGSIL